MSGIKIRLQALPLKALCCTWRFPWGNAKNYRLWLFLSTTSIKGVIFVVHLTTLTMSGTSMKAAWAQLCDTDSTYISTNIVISSQRNLWEVNCGLWRCHIWSSVDCGTETPVSFVHFHYVFFFFPDVNILTVQCFLAKQSVQLQTQSARLAQLNVFASLGIKKRKLKSFNSVCWSPL